MEGLTHVRVDTGSTPGSDSPIEEDFSSVHEKRYDQASSPANPFTPPFFPRRPSTIGSSAIDLGTPNLPVERYFHSRRINKANLERNWEVVKDPREKWVTIIPLIGMFIGLCVSGVLIWDGMRTVVNHNYCLVLDEKWDNGFNDKVWTKEAEVGGFGYATLPSSIANKSETSSQQRPVRNDNN